MSWWKRTEFMKGQILTVNRLNDINNKIIRNYFGKPDKEETFNDGRVHSAIWKIRFFNVPYTIELDANTAAREKWHEKEGKTNYRISSIEHEIVDFALVIGDSKLYDRLVRPLLKMFLHNEYNSKIAKSAITYVFEEIK